jgi:hypothetical protein
VPLFRHLLTGRRDTRRARKGRRLGHLLVPFLRPLRRRPRSARPPGNRQDRSPADHAVGNVGAADQQGAGGEDHVECRPSVATADREAQIAGDESASGRRGGPVGAPVPAIARGWRRRHGRWGPYSECPEERVGDSRRSRQVGTDRRRIALQGDTIETQMSDFGSGYRSWIFWTSGLWIETLQRR